MENDTDLGKFESPFPDPVEIEITDTFDLHSFQPSEIRSVTEIYLKEAHTRGFENVRIIHGKGIGVQREIVRNFLSKSDLVKAFKSGDELSGGGDGATVVKLKY